MNIFHIVDFIFILVMAFLNLINTLVIYRIDPQIYYILYRCTFLALFLHLLAGIEQRRLVKMIFSGSFTVN